MGDAYPELARDAARVTATLKQEEERFAETLETGMAILESALAKNSERLDGDTAFKLYDTFGFPVDLTADIGRERGFEIDMAAFDAAMAAQQERSRSASRFKSGAQLEYQGPKTGFRGYDTLSEEGRVVALYREARRWIDWTRAKRASPCSIGHPSTPNPAARSATGASSPRGARASPSSRCKTRRRSSPTSSATTES